MRLERNQNIGDKVSAGSIALGQHPLKTIYEIQDIEKDMFKGFLTALYDVATMPVGNFFRGTYDFFFNPESGYGDKKEQR